MYELNVSEDRREGLDELLVVDWEVHVHESPSALIPYIEPRWRPSLEIIKDYRETHSYLNPPALSGGGTGYRDGPIFAWASSGPRVVSTAKTLMTCRSTMQL